MKITYPTPAPSVSRYVERILVIEHHHSPVPFCLPLFANGTPTLLFHSAKGQIKNNAGYLTLFGQTISPEKLLIPEDFILIAYFLKPFSLGSLFRVTAQDLTDKPVDVTLLDNHNDLQERLLNAASVEQMLGLINDHIFLAAQKNKEDQKLIQYITEKISENPTTNILTKVQQEACLTERTLQRLFHKNVGVSPNLFRKINQFNNAFKQLNQQLFANLSDIAYDNGYADQSHYIRAFKEFTAITPTAYLQQTQVV